MVDINLVPREYRRRGETLSAIFSKTGGGILVLLILSLLLYAGLLFYQASLNKNLTSVKNEINLLDQKRDPKTEEAIVNLDRKLSILKDLFESHLYWSNLFGKIEELTVPQVYFSNAQFNFLETKLTVLFSGNALTYTTLARQILSFQEDPLVEEATVSNLSLATEGGIEFGLAVTFSTDILLKK
jgi:hypothetical protein